MTARPTLKQRMLQITLGAFMMTAALTGAVWTTLSLLKKGSLTEESEQLLAQNAGQQVEQLIPSLLLPEQKDGALLILDKIKGIEELSEARIVRDARELPEDFSSCVLNPKSVSFCQTSDESKIATLIPIHESGVDLGYIFKSRSVSGDMNARDIKKFLILSAMILGLVFCVTYFFVTRIFSRKVASSLDDLVRWIEADLEDRPNKEIQLPFEELENLKDRIASVMERHTAARDQAVVGQLTSGIMHDIRTPLQTLVTAMLMLDRTPEAGEKRTARLEHLLAMCRSKLPVLGQIIETTLDGSRRVHVEAKVSSLNESVRDGIALCDSFVSNRKAQIEIQESQVMTAHDSLQIARVVQNLVRNAIEAHADGQPMVRITLSAASQEASIVVEDNGTGLKCSPERVFRVFHSSKVRGNGLGLHISRKIIEAHGGRIAATSSSALGGARFEVILPLVGSEKTDPKKEAGGSRNEAIA